MLRRPIDFLMKLTSLAWTVWISCCWLKTNSLGLMLTAYLGASLVRCCASYLSIIMMSDFNEPHLLIVFFYFFSTLWALVSLPLSGVGAKLELYVPKAS